MRREVVHADLITHSQSQCELAVGRFVADFQQRRHHGRHGNGVASRRHTVQGHGARGFQIVVRREALPGERIERGHKQGRQSAATGVEQTMKGVEQFE